MRWRTLLAALLPLLSFQVRGEEPGFHLNLQGFLDTRLVSASDTRSWLDSGLGKARYGPGTNGSETYLRLSQASALVRLRAGDTFWAKVQINIDTDPHSASGLSGVDLIEAFAVFQPALSKTVDLRLKGGHFFPPISLENDGPAWTASRTLTASAINSWIGEEIRVTGLEASLIWLLPSSEVSLTGCIFGFNDPGGTLIAWRGWALEDRQTGLSDRLPLAALPSIQKDGLFPKQAPWVSPFREIDNVPGWYAAASFKKPEAFEAYGLVFDNRADPTSFADGQYGWRTKFHAFGLRVELPRRAELLMQYMDGYTIMGRRSAIYAGYESWFLLASLPIGPHRLSARYDRILMEDEDRFETEDPNGEDGFAWTTAYSYAITSRQTLKLEMVHTFSRRPARLLMQWPYEASETVWQLSFQFRF